MTSWDLLLCNSLPICLQSSTVAGLKLLHKIVHMPSQMYFHTSTRAFTACTVLHPLFYSPTHSATAPPTFLQPHPLCYSPTHFAPPSAGMVSCACSLPSLDMTVRAAGGSLQAAQGSPTWVD